MDIQDIKKRYAGAYIEDFGDYEIIHVDKREMDWLIEEVQHLQFENETIRRNRTTQERKDFNRIKQLEEEIKTLKSLTRLKNQELQEVKEMHDKSYQLNKSLTVRIGELLKENKEVKSMKVTIVNCGNCGKPVELKKHINKCACGARIKVLKH